MLEGTPHVQKVHFPDFSTRNVYDAGENTAQKRKNKKASKTIKNHQIGDKSETTCCKWHEKSMKNERKMMKLEEKVFFYVKNSEQPYKVIGTRVGHLTRRKVTTTRLGDLTRKFCTPFCTFFCAHLPPLPLGLGGPSSRGLGVRTSIFRFMFRFMFQFMF